MGRRVVLRALLPGLLHDRRCVCLHCLPSGHFLGLRWYHVGCGLHGVRRLHLCSSRVFVRALPPRHLRKRKLVPQVPPGHILLVDLCQSVRGLSKGEIFIPRWGEGLHQMRTRLVHPRQRVDLNQLLSTHRKCENGRSIGEEAVSDAQSGTPQ